VGFGLLPQWLQSFRTQHPNVEFELVEATGDVQLPALERGELDAGFILHSPGFAPPSLQRLRVGRESLVAALPQSHALARSRSPGLEALLEAPLVIFPRRILPSLHDSIFGLYHAHGRMPQVAQEAIQMQTIVNLVAAGLGIAWVPDSVREFQRSGVVYRSPGSGSVGRVPGCETSLVWSGLRPSPALRRLRAPAAARPRLSCAPRVRDVGPQ
jgi:DNA-binding transcriptional LysR family regulator